MNKFLAENKRFFVGANKQNLTGTVLNQSDVRIESFRAYLSALTEQDQKNHARDFKVFGQDYALEESNLLIKNGTSAELPKYVTNYLHWSFNTVTGSDATGTFDVYDMSSKRSGYGSFNNILSNEYPAVGHGFLASSNKVVDDCHSIALRQGATNEGSPGLREGYGSTYYSYFRDLDNNKVCIYSKE